MFRVKLLVVSAMLLLVSVAAAAQDVIVKRNGDRLQCRIISTDGKIVKYQLWNSSDAAVYTIDDSEYISIERQNGKTGVPVAYTSSSYSSSADKNTVLSPSATQYTTTTSYTTTTYSAADDDDDGWGGTIGLKYTASFDYADKGGISLIWHDANKGGIGVSMSLDAFYSLATKKWLDNLGMHVGLNLSLPIGKNVSFFAPLMFGVMKTSYPGGFFNNMDVLFEPSLVIHGPLALIIGWTITDVPFNSNSKIDANYFSVTIGI